MAVAGHAGSVIYDGLPHPDEAVEKGGFADIGPADDGNETHLLRMLGV